MHTERFLLASGAVLLAVSALLGFVQHRYRHRPDAFARWRVVHAGGTAGAVQLLTLAAIWTRFAGGGAAATLLAAGLVASTWAFFLGPLAGALGRPRAAGAINGLGAVVALPSYVALPMILLG